MRKAYVLLCAVLLGWMFARISSAETSLSIATGGEAGVYYPLGSGLAKALTNHLAGVEVTAIISDASAANINMIAGHEVELALVQNDVAFRAVNGERPFREPVKNLSMIASLYPEQVQCFTIPDNGIKTVADLRGKRVSVGTMDSGTIDTVSVILSAAGLRYADVNADFLDFAATALRILDDQLDAGFVVAGYPTPAVTDFAARKGVSIVAFEDDLLDKLSAEHPFFMKDVIPAGTYRGTDRDIPTIAVMAVLVCDAGLPDDLVYGITKAVFENLAELAPSHAKAEMIALDTALSAAAVKVHPGAAKYYTEQGLTVPAL